MQRPLTLLWSDMTSLASQYSAAGDHRLAIRLVDTEEVAFIPRALGMTKRSWYMGAWRSLCRTHGRDVGRPLRIHGMEGQDWGALPPRRKRPVLGARRLATPAALFEHSNTWAFMDVVDSPALEN